MPFNFPATISAEGEALTSRLFDRHLATQAKIQRQQDAIVSNLPLISLAIAVRRISMAGAGTDLETLLRFLTQGEAHRFAMIENLNALNANELTLADDATCPNILHTDSARRPLSRTAAHPLLPVFSHR